MDQAEKIGGSVDVGFGYCLDRLPFDPAQQRIAALGVARQRARDAGDGVSFHQLQRFDLGL
jgi:hypothetical protein